MKETRIADFAFGYVLGAIATITAILTAHYISYHSFFL